MNSSENWWLFDHYSYGFTIWKKMGQEEGQRTFFMNHRCTVPAHFLKYKVGLIKQVSSRPRPVSSHHHPCLQQFQVFKRSLPQIWHFSSPKRTIRFTCFQVQADLVPNLVCWAELQYLVSQYHSFHISADTARLQGVRKNKVWTLSLKRVLPLPLPFRLAKYLFPVFLETAHWRLTLWN